MLLHLLPSPHTPASELESQPNTFSLRIAVRCFKGEHLENTALALLLRPNDAVAAGKKSLVDAFPLRNSCLFKYPYGFFTLCMGTWNPGSGCYPASYRLQAPKTTLLATLFHNVTASKNAKHRGHASPSKKLLCPCTTSLQIVHVNSKGN